jgi:hypothetical protein
MRMLEGERLWATISSTAERFREHTPEGSTAVIEIETADGLSYAPAVAQRHPPSVILELAPPDATMADEIVFVVEADIRRIRMRYERGRAKQPLGFTVRETPAASSQKLSTAFSTDLS